MSGVNLLCVAAHAAVTTQNREFESNSIISNRLDHFQSFLSRQFFKLLPTYDDAFVGACSGSHRPSRGRRVRWSMDAPEPCRQGQHNFAWEWLLAR
eukprot:Skav213071  [mRNA]  locus=scaffold4152:132210:137370:- [translate_table: standard]